MKIMKNKKLVFVLFAFMAINSKSYTQCTWATNTYPGSGFLGWNNVGGSADLLFRTNNTNRGVLQNNTGFWGLGTNFTTPNQLLTLKDGNVNVQDFTFPFIQNNGYMIGNVMTLWRGAAGSATNIFVGALAGTTNVAGINNTFVGNLSGNGNTNGSRNTFVGQQSGVNNDGASDNTFLGFHAGITNTTPTSTRNTYVGGEAGASGTGAPDNSYFGYRSGYSGTGEACFANTMIGTQAGNNNQSSQHVFVGYQAGFTQLSPSVIGNTFVGYQSGFSDVGGGENAFFGYKSGFSNVASTNTFIGFRSGEFNNSGTANAFLGCFSGNQNTTGFEDVFVGSGAGRFNTTGFHNSFIGTDAGRSNTVGTSNTFNGYVAGFNNINGVKNTFIGDSAGYSNIGGVGILGSFNTFVGYVAGALNTNGRGNTFTGDSAGYNNNGNFNTFNGLRSGERNTTGSANSFYGKESGYLNTIGQLNTYVGNHCGFSANNGNQNTAIGEEAANFNKMGNNNVFAGFQSGYNTGFFAADNNNVAVGMQAGYNQRGSNNTFLGAFADEPTSAVLSNAAAIGSNTQVKSNNKMILGDTTVWVGIGVSNDNAPTLGPGNCLEINARNNTTGAIIPNTSGLRFRQLTANSPTVPNVGNMGVLALAANGDVIYVPGGGSGLGAGYCNALTQLIGNSAGYDLSTNNFYFAGNLSGNIQQNDVVIGNNCAYTPIAKLDVFQNTNVTNGSIGIYCENRDLSASLPGQEVIGIKSLIPFQANATAGLQIGVQGIVSGEKFNIAIDGLANSAALNVFNVGGRFLATSGSAIQNTGVTSTAQNGLTNHAIEGNAFNGNIATGISGQASNATTNYAGNFVANGNTGTNYAIFAQSLPAPGNGNGPNYAGWFDGDVVFTGYFGAPSDRNLKQNIDTIASALSIIDRLMPKTYFFDTIAYPQMGLQTGRQWGLIAQDVDTTILHPLVHTAIHPAITDSVGNIINPAVTFKTLDYQGLIAIMIKGMQEQQLQMDSVRAAMAAMQSQLNGCCSSNERTQNPNTNQTDVSLTNAESVVLNQNVPNPFAEQTTITYNLPESVKKAQLLFYDASGKLIKAVDLEGRGNGQINVFANDLSNGIYSYALVVDGQVANTKRMVKTQ